GLCRAPGWGGGVAAGGAGEGGGVRGDSGGVGGGGPRGVAHVLARGAPAVSIRGRAGPRTIRALGAPSPLPGRGRRHRHRGPGDVSAAAGTPRPDGLRRRPATAAGGGLGLPAGTDRGAGRTPQAAGRLMPSFSSRGRTRSVRS